MSQSHASFLAQAALTAILEKIRAYHSESYTGITTLEEVRQHAGELANLIKSHLNKIPPEQVEQDNDSILDMLCEDIATQTRINGPVITYCIAYLNAVKPKERHLILLINSLIQTALNNLSIAATGTTAAILRENILIVLIAKLPLLKVQGIIDKLLSLLQEDNSNLSTISLSECRIRFTQGRLASFANIEQQLSVQAAGNHLRKLIIFSIMARLRIYMTIEHLAKLPMVVEKLPYHGEKSKYLSYSTYFFSVTNKIQIVSQALGCSLSALNKYVEFLAQDAKPCKRSKIECQLLESVLDALRYTKGLTGVFQGFSGYPRNEVNLLAEQCAEIIFRLTYRPLLTKNPSLGELYQILYTFLPYLTQETARKCYASLQRIDPGYHTAIYLGELLHKTKSALMSRYQQLFCKNYDPGKAAEELAGRVAAAANHRIFAERNRELAVIEDVAEQKQPDASAGRANNYQ